MQYLGMSSIYVCCIKNRNFMKNNILFSSEWLTLTMCQSHYNPLTEIGWNSIQSDLSPNWHPLGDRILSSNSNRITTEVHTFPIKKIHSNWEPSLWSSLNNVNKRQSMEAALAGLGGVCELLYRRYAPPSSAATALRLHHAALRLLRHLTHNQHHMAHAPHELVPFSFLVLFMFTFLNHIY